METHTRAPSYNWQTEPVGKKEYIIKIIKIIAFYTLVVRMVIVVVAVVWPKKLWCIYYPNNDRHRCRKTKSHNQIVSCGHCCNNNGQHQRMDELMDKMKKSSQCACAHIANDDYTTNMCLFSFLVVYVFFSRVCSPMPALPPPTPSIHSLGRSSTADCFFVYRPIPFSRSLSRCFCACRRSVRLEPSRDTLHMV